MKKALKNEIAELITGSEESKRDIIIYGFDGSYRSHELGNRNRSSIDKLTAGAAKQLVKDGHAAIMYFLTPGMKEPVWMGDNYGRVIQVDSSQEDLLRKFFACEFPVINFASTSEYYKWGGMSDYEENLYRGVTGLWVDYVDSAVSKKA